MLAIRNLTIFYSGLLKLVIFVKLLLIRPLVEKSAKYLLLKLGIFMYPCAMIRICWEVIT